MSGLAGLSTMLWVPRLLYRVLGPKKKSTGAGTGTSDSPPPTPPTPSRGLRRRRSERKVDTSNALIRSPRKQKSVQFEDPESALGLSSAAPTASRNAQERIYLKRRLRRWTLIFAFVMMLCVINLVILDVLWARKGGFLRSASTTVSYSDTSGNATTTGSGSGNGTTSGTGTGSGSSNSGGGTFGGDIVVDK